MIITRYIFREITIPFLLGIGILTTTALLGKSLKLIELVVNHGIGLGTLSMFTLYTLPSLLIYIIPVSFLMAVLVAFNRLSGDMEIIAMKASGLSLLRLSWPVLVMAVFSYIITLFLTLYAFPWGNLSYKKLLYDVVKVGPGLGIKERVFNSTFEGLVLYINRVKENELDGILISEEKEGKENNVIIARKGILLSNPATLTLTLRLMDGTIHNRGERGGLYRLTTFNTYDLTLGLKKRDGEETLSNRELSLKGLRDRIGDVKKRKENPAPYIIDLHKRFALPAAVFTFGLLGVPLGIQKVRSGRFRGFCIGLLIVIVYYILSTAMESAGEGGSINPLVAVWGSDIGMGILGLCIFYKATRESPVKALVWLEDRIDRTIVKIKDLLGGRG
ncbi:MAG: LPS export ABC transporter permease LptF [Deltaproteobacteria bacterium]|nr:LPS export ABC transporter permease LptF [Deltaproteobacteria bacterium]